MPTTLHITNMVCDRCIRSVERTLSGLGYEVASVDLGEATVAENVSMADKNTIADALEAEGFELVRSREEHIVTQIKSTLIRYLQAVEDGETPGNLSDVISKSLHQGYPSLSALFSKQTGQTIRDLFIALKIERAKDLLANGSLTTADIADRLGYSSTQHLSTQFHQVTGQTLAEWRESPGARMKWDAKSIQHG
jgi:AraC-like DNA-binding protein